LHLHVAPATPLGRRTPRYLAEISRGYPRMRVQASRAAAEQVGSVARFGWHAPPGVKCHTCVLTVYAHKVAPVASTAAARVVSQSFDCRERRPGTVHRSAKFCKLLQTIANYCTCMWRIWGTSGSRRTDQSESSRKHFSMAFLTLNGMVFPWCFSGTGGCSDLGHQGCSLTILCKRTIWGTSGSRRTDQLELPRKHLSVAIPTLDGVAFPWCFSGTGGHSDLGHQVCSLTTLCKRTIWSTLGGQQPPPTRLGRISAEKPFRGGFST